MVLHPELGSSGGIMSYHEPRLAPSNRWSLVQTQWSWLTFSPFFLASRSMRLYCMHYVRVLGKVQDSIMRGLRSQNRTMSDSMIWGHAYVASWSVAPNHGWTTVQAPLNGLYKTFTYASYPPFCTKASVIRLFLLTETEVQKMLMVSNSLFNDKLVSQRWRQEGFLQRSCKITIFDLIFEQWSYEIPVKIHLAIAVGGERKNEEKCQWLLDLNQQPPGYLC